MSLTRCSAPKPGTPSGYTKHGCRCTECGEASRLYKKRWREGRLIPAHVDATGAIRRIRALQAIGYPLEDLGSRFKALGSGVKLSDLLRQTLVTRQTDDLIAQLFEELCMTIGPSSRTRTWARKAGFPPPLAWDDIDADAHPPNTTRDNGIDEIAVTRACSERVSVTTLSEQERLTAVAHMTQQGLPKTEQARRLGTYVRRIERDCKKLVQRGKLPCKTAN